MSKSPRALKILRRWTYVLGTGTLLQTGTCIEAIEQQLNDVGQRLIALEPAVQQLQNDAIGIVAPVAGNLVANTINFFLSSALLRMVG